MIILTVKDVLRIYFGILLFKLKIINFVIGNYCVSSHITKFGEFGEFCGLGTIFHKEHEA